MFPVDEIIDHTGLQRPRAEQSHESHNILKAVWKQAFDQLLHAPGLELKYGGGFRPLQKPKDPIVIQRNVVNIQSQLVPRRAQRVNGFERPVDNREGPKAQKVELHQPRALDVVLIKLGHEGALLVRDEGYEIRKLPWSNNHTARVLSDVAHQAFQGEGHVHDFTDLFVLRNEGLQGGLLLEGLVQGHADLEGDHFGKLVGEAVGLTLDPGNVPHHGLRSHGAVGHDLRNGSGAVEVCHMADNPVPAFHAKIYIKVGHGHSLGIQEALKQQVVGQGIEISNAERIGHQEPAPEPRPGPTGTPLPFAQAINSATMRK